MEKTVKQKWIEAHKEEIINAYPRFVKAIEKQNRQIEEKVNRRNELMEKTRPGDMLTPEQRELLDFNPYSCSKVLPREFKRYFGAFFEGCPFNDHMGAVERYLNLNIKGLFRYSLSYFL